MGKAIIEIQASALKLLETNRPAVVTKLITNIETDVAMFDDTTEEKGNFKFEAPALLDTAGTVTFRVSGLSGTAAASKNIELKIYHGARADGEDIDALTYSSKESGDLATSATQNAREQFEFTETVTNLGWSAKDQIYAQLSRIAPSVNNLVGDWWFETLVIEIPTT